MLRSQLLPRRRRFLRKSRNGKNAGGALLQRLMDDLRQPDPRRIAGIRESHVRVLPLAKLLPGSRLLRLESRNGAATGNENPGRVGEYANCGWLGMGDPAVA